MSQNKPAVLADCFTMAQTFEAIEFKLGMTDANQVAHQLAKSSCLSISVVSWDVDPPGFIMPYVITDVISLDQKKMHLIAFPYFF
jgi:hypothetical protein